jgi:hypothetical protein
MRPRERLTASERRILRAALREFQAALQSDFNTLREYHKFLHEEDGQALVGVLAEKLGVQIAEDAAGERPSPQAAPSAARASGGEVLTCDARFTRG